MVPDFSGTIFYCRPRAEHSSFGPAETFRLLYEPAEEFPQLLARVDVLLAPRVFAADDFVKPHLASPSAAREAVRDHRAAAGGLCRQRVGLHDGAAVLRRPVMYGQRHGQISSPAAFVLRIAQPCRGLVLRAVDFEERNRRRTPVRFVEPVEHQSRNRRHGGEQAGTLRRQLVTHLSAVRHARAEDVVPAQSVLFLQMAHQLGQEPHVVDGHVGLKGVSHVPAALAASVFGALRVADGETVAVGRGVHGETVGIVVAAVAVQDDDQRGVLRQAGGQVQFVGALHAARTQDVIRGLRRRGLRPAAGCCEEQKGRKKKTLCRGGFQQVSHFQQYSIYRPLRAMRHARLLYSPISGARQLRGRALRTRTLRSVRR